MSDAPPPSPARQGDASTPTPPAGGSRRAWIVGWIIAIVVVNAIAVPIFAFRNTTELDVYSMAAARLIDGEEIYRGVNDIVSIDGERRHIAAFTYPPLFAFVVTPIAPLGEKGERVAWCVVQVTLAVILIAGLWYALRPRLRAESGAHTRAETTFWVIMVLIGLRYLLSPLENQSHDMIVAALVGLGAVAGAKQRDGLGGALIGIATALKATPLLFMPVFVLQRRWKATIAMGIAMVIASAVPDLVMPARDGRSNMIRWITFASGAATPGANGDDVVFHPWNKLNQNLAGTLHRLTARPTRAVEGPDVTIVELPEAARRPITLALQAVVLLAVMATVVRSTRLGGAADSDTTVHRRLGEAGVVACGMILLSPMSSKAHYCALLIGLAALAVAFARRPRAGLGAMLALMFLSSTLVAKGILGSEPGNFFLAIGSTMLSAAVLMVALIAGLVRRPVSEPA